MSDKDAAVVFYFPKVGEGVALGSGVMAGFSEADEEINKLLGPRDTGEGYLLLEVYYILDAAADVNLEVLLSECFIDMEGDSWRELDKSFYAKLCSILDESYV